MEFEIVDLRDIGNLEKSAGAFLQAIEAAEPALGRLEQAHCPGAGHVSYVLGETVEKLQHLAEALEDVRLADGNQAAWDYRFYMVRLGLTRDDAAHELIGLDEDGIKRVEPMRLFAATVA